MSPITAAGSVVGIIGGLSMAVMETMNSITTSTLGTITETTTTTLAITFSGISLAAVLAWRVSQAWAKQNHQIETLQKGLEDLRSEMEHRTYRGGRR